MPFIYLLNMLSRVFFCAYKQNHFFNRYLWLNKLNIYDVHKFIFTAFRIFELETKVNGVCVDYVNLHDGSSTSAVTLNASPLCGTVYRSVYTSTSNFLTVYFQSDSTGARQGFDYIFVAITTGIHKLQMSISAIVVNEPFFMSPPFEEWGRGMKCYPCPCVRASVRACVRPSVIKIWCPLNYFWKTASIQFKFGMVKYKNIKTQVKFDLGYNPLNFDGVMGLL